MSWSLSKNLIGPQGAPGPTGEPGPAGATGAAGEPGPAGAACNTEFRVEAGVPQFLLAAEGRWVNLSIEGTKASAFVIDPALEPRSIGLEGG